MDRRSMTIGRPRDSGSFENKSRSDQKTVVCKFLQSPGGCSKGKECSFLHPKSIKSIAVKKMISGKDQLCDKWLVGECRFGDQCKYAHGEHEIVSKTESNPLYKTTMCSSFPDGVCSKGEQCSFAHSEEELRKADPATINKLKKNTACKNIVEKGFCPMQRTCHFNHDMQTNQQQQMFNQQHTGGGGGGMFNPGNLLGAHQGQQQQQHQRQQRHGFPQLSCQFVTIQSMMSMFLCDPHSNVGHTLCKNILEKKSCEFGDRCRHAHKESEMRLIPEKDPGPKGTLCKFNELNGECKFGEECKFSHSQKELIKYSKRPGMNSALCKQFQEGRCIYGINCSFSHAIPRDSLNWKATYCRNKEGEGECKFGVKCDFAHNEKELRTHQQNEEHIELTHNMQVVNEWKMMGLNLEEEFRKAMMQMGGGIMGGNSGMMGGDGGMMGGDGGMIGGNGGMVGGNSGMMGGNGSMMGGGNSDMMGRGMIGGMMEGGGRLSSGRQERPVLLPGNIPVALVKKPELCPLWLDEGRCASVTTCLYAHGQKELLQIKADMMIAATGGGVAAGGYGGGVAAAGFGVGSRTAGGPAYIEPPVLDGKYKVVMCEFRSNDCPNGPRCNFAHSYDELYRFRMKQVPNYKRSICKSWEDNGSCQWDQTCMFAHGNHELSDNWNNSTT